MLAYLFPGQGSQKAEMGADILEDFQRNMLHKLAAAIQKEASPLIAAKLPDENPDRNSEENNNNSSDSILPLNLGSKEFKTEYNLKYAYYAGAMFRGISSKEMVIKLGNEGLMGALGTGGLTLSQIEEAIKYIQPQMKPSASFCCNLLNSLDNPDLEKQTIDLYLKYHVNIIEASAYMQLSTPIIKYRLKGLKRVSNGSVKISNHIIAKISRPEVATAFLSPIPEQLIKKLLDLKEITEEEALLAKDIPLVDDICVEADSGGHTDMGIISTLLPAILQLRDELTIKYKYKKKVRVGAAGGIGTPYAAAAAFIMGADFIVTGSINQCTVEAGQSDLVKEMLQDINVQDTDYAPAGDMFEIGAKVQVIRKGVFFPARANKLYDLYTHYNSIDEIDMDTRKQIEEKYFKKSFQAIWDETSQYFKNVKPDEITKANQNPKRKMALIFRWYFYHSIQAALAGNSDFKIDFQVHCGPALGAFNQWVKGTELESWKNRHVDKIADKLMTETCQLLNQRYNGMK